MTLLLLLFQRTGNQSRRSNVGIDSLSMIEMIELIEMMIEVIEVIELIVSILLRS